MIDEMEMEMERDRNLFIQKVIFLLIFAFEFLTISFVIIRSISIQQNKQTNVKLQISFVQSHLKLTYMIEERVRENEKKRVLR
jgi:hypothetical protein